jgi:hypothetical protein
MSYIYQDFPIPEKHFELDHFLGEGETFMFAAAERRRQEANQV